VSTLEGDISGLEEAYSKAESEYKVQSAGLEKLKANVATQSAQVTTQE